MPFIAMDRTTKERIDITQFTEPRAQINRGDVVCPVCESSMIIKNGMILRAHFSHKAGREDCPYADYASGETQEHLDAKIAVRDQVGEWFGEFGVAKPELEVYIPDTKHARNRIADVLFTFPRGWRVAHEIQLASITVKDLEERTDDYLNAGIDVFWWFGRDAATRSNFEWSMKNYGFVLHVHVDNEESSAAYVLQDTSRSHPIASAMVGK